jgi:transcriptional regulator GlxA family with amidase domain
LKAAFVVFDHMTLLDFIGFYDPLGRLKTMKLLPALEWNVCAMRGKVVDDRGLEMLADRAGQSLEGFDLLFVPGGFGTRGLQHDAAFMEWLRTGAAARLKVSVCTGALLLGAAGWLRGLRATTHPNALEELASYCGTVVEERIVDEGDVITAGGVATSIDLGLHVVERLAGAQARDRIAKQMDYPYRPQRA